jgi:DNA-binding Lrp family transcriptional regulator
MLINTELGREKDLFHQLTFVQNVKEVHITYGIYDLIAIIEAESLERLKQVITSEIRSLSGVKSTLTMMVAE